MTRCSLFLLLALMILGCTSSPGVNAQGLFYLANKTERIELVPSRRTVGVRVAPGQERAFANFAGSEASLDLLDLPDLRDRYGVFLIRASDSSDEFAPSFALDTLRQSPAFDASIPVFESGAIELAFVGRYKVRFTARATSADIEASLRRTGAENINRRDSDTGRYVFEIPDATFEEGLERIRQLNSQGIVRYSEPDFVRIYPPRLTTAMARRTLERIGKGPRFVAQTGNSSDCNPSDGPAADPSLPLDPLFGNQWSLDNKGNNPILGNPGADVGYVDAMPEVNADAIKVAILDLGVDADHDDLDAAIVDQVDATGSGGVSIQHASNNHGTRVAGIVGAEVGNQIGMTGIASSVQLVSVRIARAQCEDCSWITLDGSEWRGIRAAVDRNADVIVNSWAEAGGGFDSDIYAEIQDAIAAGSVVVFSAGNHYWEYRVDATGTAFPVQGPAAVLFPASLAATAADEAVRLGLIAVSATNQFDEFKTHEFEQEFPVASQDSESAWGSNRGPAVSLAAPGVHIYTTDVGNDYTCFSGTSAAAPLVGGAAAILMQQFPDATPAQVKRWLQDGADKLYLTAAGAERDDFIGHGRLNVAGAIAAAKTESG
ncbi:MAG: S8 family serine peptidase, partial [Pseudomonadota bacterium]